MENKYLLTQYMLLPTTIKNNLSYLNAIHKCYEHDNGMPDHIVLNFCNLAFNMKEHNNSLDISKCIDYLIDCFYIPSKKEAMPFSILDAEEIEEYYEENRNANELLDFAWYAFTTSENERYYVNADYPEFYVLSKDDLLVKKVDPTIIGYIQFVLNFFKENKIIDFSIDMHDVLRHTIRERMEFNENLDIDGIEAYKKYCLKHFITNEDLDMAKDFFLTDIDNYYTNEKKLTRLKGIISDKKIFQNYDYVASLSNGTDYYYSENLDLYIALDQNNISKNFKSEELFLLKQLDKDMQFAFINKKELKKISELLEDNFLNFDFENFDSKMLNSISKFLKYTESKSKNYFNDKDILIRMKKSILNRQEFYENMRKKNNMIKTSDYTI